MVFVVKEAFVTFGSSIFRQSKGVPMGGAASAQLADLTLSVLEYKFVQHTKNTQITTNLQYMCRYMDDLICFNCNNFMSLSSDIYLDVLQLKQTNTNHKIADFLDCTYNLITAQITV